MKALYWEKIFSPWWTLQGPESEPLNATNAGELDRMRMLSEKLKDFDQSLTVKPLATEARRKPEQLPVANRSIYPSLVQFASIHTVMSHTLCWKVFRLFFDQKASSFSTIQLLSRWIVHSGRILWFKTETQNDNLDFELRIASNWLNGRNRLLDSELKHRTPTTNTISEVQQRAPTMNPRVEWEQAKSGGWLMV